MNIPKLRVPKDNTVLFICPHCGNKSTGDVSRFQGRVTPLKVKCPCKEEFKVLLEFRNTRRKESFLRGYYTKLPDGSEKGRIRVRDISLGGVRFSTWNAHNLKEGDKIRVECVLDDVKGSEIDKNAIVRWVKDDAVGCQFSDSAEYDSDLGFYFMS